MDGASTVNIVIGISISIINKLHVGLVRCTSQGAIFVNYR